MNCLIFDDSDLDSQGTLRVNGRRAEHLLAVLHVQPGSNVRVGKLNGNCGSAVVREISGEQVFLDVQDLNDVIPSSLKLTLMLAMPRPQSLKKVLQSAAALGVRRIVLHSAARVEKAYFSSPLLREENLKHYLLLGLEQAGATDIPEVSIIQNFFPGSRADRSKNDCAIFETACKEADYRLLPHPSAKNTLLGTVGAAGIAAERSVVLAVGPEGGWRPAEVAALEEMNFKSFQLGPRVLRVETALDFVLGQLQLLRELSVV